MRNTIFQTSSTIQLEYLLYEYCLNLVGFLLIIIVYCKFSLKDRHFILIYTLCIKTFVSKPYWKRPCVTTSPGLPYVKYAIFHHNLSWSNRFLTRQILGQRYRI